MAAEASMLPLSMSVLLESSQTSDLLKNDPFLQELIDNQEGDLLTSLLSLPSEALLRNDCYGEVPSMFQLDPLPTLPASPVGSRGCSTEASSTSHTNTARSPTASITSLGHSMQSGGDSPCQSPMMTPSDPSRLIPDSTQWCLDNFQVADIPYQELDNIFSASPDIKIDVESLRASTSSASPPDISSSSSRKAATLLLTDEEKKLLSEEGIALPTDMPLTKAEQKHLKRVRRKIKNKISAQDSRKKKKDYMEGLEDRVRMSTEKNQRQAKEMENLRVENQSLMKQLRELHELVVKYIPSKAWTGTAGKVLMVLVLSFSLFLVPIVPDRGRNNQLARAQARHSRNLLFAETDEFGNVVDPNTRKIISVAGGQTPYPLPPWLDQTPVILAWMNKTRLTTTARDEPDKVSSPSPALVEEENVHGDSAR